MSEKTKRFHSGWDHFTPEPGKKKKMFCRVCKEKMDVKRNVKGATGWAEAMSVAHGKSEGHLHDTFSCPLAQEDWHNQARILKERIEKETSRLVAKLLKKELKQVLKTRKPTKKMGWSYL
jgi:hypothetical protein